MINTLQQKLVQTEAKIRTTMKTRFLFYVEGVSPCFTSCLCLFPAAVIVCYTCQCLSSASFCSLRFIHLYLVNLYIFLTCCSSLLSFCGLTVFVWIQLYFV